MFDERRWRRGRSNVLKRHVGHRSRFVAKRGSDLFSIDDSKVVDVPICTQFVFTEQFPGFCAAHFICR